MLVYLISREKDPKERKIAQINFNMINRKYVEIRKVGNTGSGEEGQDRLRTVEGGHWLIWVREQCLFQSTCGIFEGRQS